MRLVPKKKWTLNFLSDKFFVTTYEYVPYGPRVVLILLVSEMQKIQRAKVEAHFLKKLAFVTNECLARDAFSTTENLSKYKSVRE